ncbi:MAG: rRNA (cytosine967-C5)-methyltransferase [Pseudomonadota bacterium]|nr:rRNA (cytosine967-C5)-methyltransferase [Pseudomonadota bacterium]
MSDYLIIIHILNAVLSGKNLTETFTANIGKIATADINTRVGIKTRADKDLAYTQINIGKIKDICYGVVRNYYRLQAVLSQIVSRTPEDKNLQILLLIGVYELEYTKKAPYAAVNELVNLSLELSTNQRVKNFINGVMRSYLREREQLHQQAAAQPEYKYNFPHWLIHKLKQEYPNKYSQLIENSNSIPKIALRVNLSKISFDDYVKILNNAAIDFDLIENKIVLKLLLKVEQIPFFQDGYVSIQDISAQRLIELVKPQKGDYILDACCAPGGKMCQILEHSQVKLLGLDISKTRLNKVKQNLVRLGLSADLIEADASKCDWWQACDSPLFDTIIADVPCSASGTLKRNPDIKLNRRLLDIDNFVILQRKIVSNLWQMLKPGGKMVYITCSIFKEENHDNIEFFSQRLSDVLVIREFNILPTPFADGFYYCVLEKSIN